jgi:hypothetical protein
MLAFPTQAEVKITLEVLCDDCGHSYPIVYVQHSGIFTRRLVVTPHACPGVPSDAAPPPE